LIFTGVDNTWYIWAVRGKLFRPDLGLFHAPLPNVGGDGNICFGNNRPPVVGKDGEQAAWNLFMSTPFNLHNADGKSAEHPKNIISKLSCLSKRKAVRYPTRDLISQRCTIEQAVQHLINR
jgi:hypothetical protein